MPGARPFILACALVQGRCGMLCRVSHFVADSSNHSAPIIFYSHILKIVFQSRFFKSLRPNNISFSYFKKQYSKEFSCFFYHFPLALQLYKENVQKIQRNFFPSHIPLEYFLEKISFRGCIPELKTLLQTPISMAQHHL